ncbi:MAG: DUF2149 domain-containing protein [Muricomes sp.]
MIRRFGSRRLSRENGQNEDVTPMWGVANMADVMLVLAVGVMVALVANWNLDIGIGSVKQLNADQGELRELSEFTTMKDKDFAEKIKKSGLEELGSVYVEPDSGKMYVIVEGSGEVEEP